MSSRSDADGIRPGAVPGPRGAELPLPPAALPGGSHDGDIADGLEEAYWSVYDGAASQATVGQILARLPRIVRQIGRLAWAADRTATLSVVVLQLASAAMTAFGLMASVAVLRELFAEGPTPDRVRAAIPQLLVVIGFLSARALLEAGVAIAQARVTPQVRTALETEFLTLTAHVRLKVVDDADWHDEAYRANDRRASVVACDRIFVFDGGRITESGTHQELMSLGAEYADMFTLQAAGYRAEAGEAA